MAKSQAIAPHFNPTLWIGLGVAAAAAVASVILVARPHEVSAYTTPPAATEQPARMLSAREQSFDFGTISMAAGKVTHNFWIRNAGTTPIDLRTMYTSCMCTTASLVKGGKKTAPVGMAGHGYIPPLNETLGPNEAAMVEVVFDPAAHGPAGIGRIERVVTIENDRERPLELGFVANVTP